MKIVIEKRSITISNILKENVKSKSDKGNMGLMAH